MDLKLHWRAALLTVIAIAVCLIASRSITGTRIEGDSKQTLLMAINLQHHGVISLDRQAPFTPSMYREPIPVVVGALAVGVVDSIYGKADADSYLQGDRVRLLKFQDLGWLAVLYFAAFLASGLFFTYFPLRLAIAVLVCSPYITKATDVGQSLDAMYTDIAAAAVLMLATFFLAKAALTRRPLFWVIAGVSFGVLTLIKAAFLYIFVGTVVGALLYFVLERRSFALSRGALQVVLAAFAFGVTIAPWMLRNQHQLGELELTERGGEVLIVRALKDQMTLDEYVGSFYVWGPARSLMGKLLGYTQRDLNRGGRLQRLNRANESDFNLSDRAAEKAGRPDRAVSFFRVSRAEYVRLVKVFTQAGNKHPSAAADHVLKQRAIDLIVAHPFRHLALTLPMLWRGAVFTFPVLLVALAYSLRTRRYELALFLLPAFGAVMFYALLSHFIPRYAEPLYPIAILGGVVLLGALVGRFAPYEQSTTDLRPGALHPEPMKARRAAQID